MAGGTADGGSPRAVREPKPRPTARTVLRVLLVLFAGGLLSSDSGAGSPDHRLLWSGALGAPAADAAADEARLPEPLLDLPPAETPEPRGALVSEPEPFAVPALEEILGRAAAAWPEEPEKARGIAFCELGGWANPEAFRLDDPYLGPMQLDAATWEPFFLALRGWTREQLARDLTVHFEAARVVYDRAGGWHPWPVCGLS